MLLPRLVLFTAALMALTSAFAAEKIVVGFPNPIGFSIGNGPYWMALEMKFFEAEGLDVEVINFNSGALMHTQVAQKKIDVGWVNPIDFRQPGRDALPTKFFYNDLGKWIWEIVVLQDSPVRSIHQLKGKTIAVGSLAFSNIRVTRALLVDAGIKPDVDTRIVAVGMGMSALEALRAGRIDAVNLFDAAHETMAAQGGVVLRRLEMPEKYLSLISNSFNAHEDTIKSPPKLSPASAGPGPRGW